MELIQAEYLVHCTTTTVAVFHWQRSLLGRFPTLLSTPHTPPAWLTRLDVSPSMLLRRFSLTVSFCPAPFFTHVFPLSCFLENVCAPTGKWDWALSSISSWVDQCLQSKPSVSCHPPLCSAAPRAPDSAVGSCGCMCRWEAVIWKKYSFLKGVLKWSAKNPAAKSNNKNLKKTGVFRLLFPQAAF